MSLEYKAAFNDAMQMAKAEIIKLRMGLNEELYKTTHAVLETLHRVYTDIQEKVKNEKS